MTISFKLTKAKYNPSSNTFRLIGDNLPWVMTMLTMIGSFEMGMQLVKNPFRRFVGHLFRPID